MDGAKPGATLTREERLAAQLRANLRRRKQQARALGQAPGLDADRAAPPSADPCAPVAINPAPDKPPLAKPPLTKPPLAKPSLAKPRYDG